MPVTLSRGSQHQCEGGVPVTLSRGSQHKCEGGVTLGGALDGDGLSATNLNSFSPPDGGGHWGWE